MSTISREKANCVLAFLDQLQKNKHTSAHMTGILLEQTTANTVSRRIVLIGFYMHVHNKIKLTVPTLLLIYTCHTGNLIVAESISSFRKKK